MTVDPLVLLPELDRATDRLLRTVADLDDAAVTGPSLLPGWTRGHVLTHLARNADGYVNLLTAARTGEDIPQYASPEARDADIAAGGGRPAAAQLADLRSSAEQFAELARSMPVQAWAAKVRASRGPRVAATLIWGRLREVEVHHVDLAAGYSTADWPDAFSQRVLHEVLKDLAGRDGSPALVLRPTETEQPLALGPADAAPTVTGPAHALAGWLTGRSAGDDLVVTPSGPLPAPPAWL
ncbi:maleylpyruvate isomerase family mycothiol-dependent enzyme [Plantactinospora sp. CA-290183]|uniref:maleylpyruvate isomerase family mycothiol-dependent enzyme n=1 Tax=Plantactinospora sp. CA-290183 TaxID=3240006 RepID=UPI003D8DD5BE